MKDGNASQTAAATGGSGPAAASPDLSGCTLGDFQVLRRLGEGGMGQVYLAEQLSLKRKVALKILRADLAADPTALKRFKAEAEAVARATHANIVQVYAIEEREGLHYMALEYVEGRNLRQYLAKKGPPETLLALSVMRQVAAALQRASELGIIHRDVKPENILLTRKGEVKVADFGLSRVRASDQPPLNLTQSGVAMGTPLYMSPEQVQGQPVDPRTDVYSFGVTCYHMLAGQPPFQGKTPFEVALHHVNSPPAPLTQVRPDLPPDLCAIVHKMMAKEPAQRYQTCGDLLKDLARVREALGAAAPGQLTQAISLDSVSGLLAPPPSPVSASVPTQAAPPRRSVVPVLFAATVLLALATGAGAAWLLRARLASAPTTEVAGTAPADAKPAELMSLREREEFFKKAVELYATSPGKDPSQTRRGLESLVDLGLFYLEQGRLKEADELFNEQENTEIQRFRGFGRLGHAIVLALENRAAESNKQLLEVLVEERPGPGRVDLYVFLNQNPKLRSWIATALDYNADNGVTPPRELDHLRKPTPRLVPPGPRPPMDK